MHISKDSKWNYLKHNE